MYSYLDALRYVLKEREQHLIDVKESLNQAKFNELIGYAIFNMWNNIAYTQSYQSPMISKEELEGRLADISEKRIHYNQDLQEECLTFIQIYEHQINWLKSQIAHYELKEMKSNNEESVDVDVDADIIGPYPIDFRKAIKALTMKNEI